MALLGKRRPLGNACKVWVLRRCPRRNGDLHGKKVAGMRRKDPQRKTHCHVPGHGTKCIVAAETHSVERHRRNRLRRRGERDIICEQLESEPEMKCGSCTKIITSRNRRPRYTTLCKDCTIPHNACQNLGDGRWLCTYCGQVDTYEELFSADCGNAEPTPCQSCGGTPYCTLDCEAIWAILNDPFVYVAGLPQ